MIDVLIEQLREKAKWRENDIHGDLHTASADEIERLRSEIERRNFIRVMSGPDAHDKAEIWHRLANENAIEADRLRDALQGLVDFIEIDQLKMDPLALSIARAALALPQAASGSGDK